MCSCLARWLRGLSGYCTHLLRWLLWRKWHFNSLCFFVIGCVCDWVCICGCVCLPWPNTGPKWGQASHTLHSACLAGTASANQDRLGSRFQYGTPSSPPPPPFPSFFRALRNLSSPLSISFLPFFIHSLPASFLFAFVFSFILTILHLCACDFPSATTTTQANMTVFAP